MRKILASNPDSKKALKQLRRYDFVLAKLMELLKFLQAHKAKYFADECAPRRGGVLVRVASSHACPRHGR